MENITEVNWRTETTRMQLDDLTIHSLAKITPSSTTYATMLNSISIDGQKDPVYIYRGQITDGRHRYRALREIGEDTIIVAKMPNNWSLKRVREEVVSIEVNRRHQTPTQRAIFAYKELQEAKNSGEKMTIKDASMLFGSNEKMIQRVGKICEVQKPFSSRVKFGRPDLIEILFNGESINVGDEYNKIPTDSLDSIARYLERQMSSSHADVTGLNSLEEEPTESDIIFINQVINKLEDRSMVCKRALNSRIYGKYIIGEK